MLNISHTKHIKIGKDVSRGGGVSIHGRLNCSTSSIA